MTKRKKVMSSERRTSGNPAKAFQVKSVGLLTNKRLIIMKQTNIFFQMHSYEDMY